jgi:hypothetical protein
MPYIATRQHVYNRGIPPASFLDALVEWGKTAPDEIFTPNSVSDIYSSIRNVLGPWEGTDHRRAVMLEVLRVLAGFESSWDWHEGRDTSNPDSDMPDEIEAGAFQVSANSMNFGAELKDLVREHTGGSLNSNVFQAIMKSDRPLAIEYCARLLRRTVRHHGPVRDHHIDAWLRRDAVEEFKSLLGSEPAVQPAGSPGSHAGDGHGSSNPHRKPPIARFVQSPFHSSRNGSPIRKIVLHCTEASLSSTLEIFTEDTDRQVSAHYVIDRDGSIIQMVSDSDRANHARGANQDSIGIEHVGRDTDTLTTEQGHASASLIRWLLQQYNIPKSQVYGHDFAPGYDRSDGGTSCPDLLFGGGHSQDVVQAWVQANV